MKLTTLRDAVARYVEDGAVVAIEGFTALSCFAAAHEIIRQGRRDLTLCRMAPGVIYDQLIAAGCARKLVFSYLGNPGVGPLFCIRRAVETGVPRPLELEEYSHFGMVARYMAAASHLPFFPLRSYTGTDLAAANPLIRTVADPYGSGPIAVVPPLAPDVAILHAQRADAAGNTQIWGVIGTQAEVAFAAKKVIVVVEEVVDEAVIRADPNRTVIPHIVVDAVVELPRGAHPSYVQGYYDRDDAFYLAWDKVSRTHASVAAWLDEWVYGVADWKCYLAKLEAQEPGVWERLGAGRAVAQPVNYGQYPARGAT